MPDFASSAVRITLHGEATSNPSNSFKCLHQSCKLQFVIAFLRASTTQSRLCFFSVFQTQLPALRVTVHHFHQKTLFIGGLNDSTPVEMSSIATMRNRGERFFRITNIFHQGLTRHPRSICMQRISLELLSCSHCAAKPTPKTF